MILVREERYIWFRYGPEDYLGVREKLNRLADQGWELAEERDCHCCFARFTPTARTELTYDVEPVPLLRKEEAVQDAVLAREAEGWEPVATLNGMDIYRSIPLRFPKPREGEAAAQNCRTILAQRYGVSVAALLAVLAAAVYLYRTGGTWYLSNLSLWLLGTALPVTVGGLFWLGRRTVCLMRRTPRPVPPWSRMAGSVLAALGRVWLLLTAFMLALDQLTAAAACLVALCYLAAAGAVSSLWRRRDFSLYRRVAALVTGIAILSAYLLSLAYPGRVSVSILDEYTRLQYREEAVVQLEDLGLEGEDLLSGSYQRSGSFLVTCTSYTEYWMLDGEMATLSTTSYVCRLGSAEWVYEQLSAEVGAEEILYRSGNTVVRFSAPIKGLTWEDVAAALNEG
ncbi:MAG: DUF2812 domain-containing protein [Clostridiales bacterium]|nr:DUF2812 domain-containing protein [Clostridiales bacterium]